MLSTGVFWALPEPLSLGPGWLLLAVIFVLMIPIVITNIRRLLQDHANREMPRVRFYAQPWRCGSPIFWSSLLWYWKLDAGGPLGHDHSRRKIASAFLFPQLSSDREHYDSWSPQFLDYQYCCIQHEHCLLTD